MEFNVLSAAGLPKNGVISIRAGGTRRQVQLASIDKPLKFPCKPEDVSNVKVDVLHPVGSARLPFDPAAHKYTLELDPVDDSHPRRFGSVHNHQNMEVSFEVRRVDNADGSFLDESYQKEDESNAYRHRKEVEAHGYLEEHGLVSFMQYLLHGLMQDKPADPYVFLKKQIDIKSSQKESSRAGSYAYAGSYVAGSGGYPSNPPSQVGTVYGKALAPRPASSGLRGSRPASSGSRIAIDAANQVFAMPSFAPSDVTVEDKELNNLLRSLSPRAASSVPAEDLHDLERQALEAVERTRAENALLRQTAEQLKGEYQALMQESSDLNILKQKKETGREAGNLENFAKYYKNNIISQPRDDFLTRLHWEFPSGQDSVIKAASRFGKGPSKRADSATLAAWREIEKLQEELSQLAQQNARLVAELAHMREMIELVRSDIKDMISSLDDVAPS